MLATIAKQFTFHAAHRLPNHDGQCRDLHGHTYTLEVSVTGPSKLPSGEPDEGMVMDFGIIKEVYKFCIEPHVEHKYLNESLAGKHWGDGDPWLPQVRGAQYNEPLTTCENLAEWIRRMFDNELPRINGGGLNERKVLIRLWETPTSYAEVGDTAWRR
jgi:6-pyruvoyltetrahydropterin/6-carboxytetrahydropterin synthase